MELAARSFSGSLVLLPSIPAAGAPRHDPIYGCTLPRREADSFFAVATESRWYLTGDEPMIPKSGDPAFDYALAQTLAKISNMFDVAPGFAYYAGNNAYATRSTKMNGSDGTVVFGDGLLDQLLKRTDAPDAAIACVCAHEFGHILQYKLGLYDQLNKDAPTIKRVELQADFFAGYFAGIRKRERPSFPAAVFAMTQFTLGDESLNDPKHHGTHEERGAAVVRGFDVAFRERRPLGEAIDISTTYVKQL